MTDKELEPQRDQMVAALYGELPPEEEEVFLTRLADDPALKAEWDELQEARGFLGAADAADTAPGFVFALPAATRAGSATPPGARGRLRSLWHGMLLRPAAGFALAAAACVVLMIAGLRVDRVPGGLAVHFGPTAPSRPTLAGATLAENGGTRGNASELAGAQGAPGLAEAQGTEVPSTLEGGPVLAPGGDEAGVARGGTPLDLSAPVTRAELAAFAQQLVSATETRLQQQEDRNLGQTVYMLRDYHRTMEEARQRDRREITADVNRAFLALLQAGALGGERLELPRGQAAGDSTPIAVPLRQTEEGEPHE